MSDHTLASSDVIAAIDVGTNSFHMVIATVSARGVLKVIARNKEMVRLGSAAADMKMLQPDAMQRGVLTMKRFVEEARHHNAHILAVATSAVREALNRDEFVHQVLEATGVEIEVVSGTEEGRLIYLGASHALPISNVHTLVMDIGGGSTETILGYKGEVDYVHSAKLGHIRMTTRFFPDGRATQEAVDECREVIRGVWTPAFQAINALGFERVVGCSGTIMALVNMTLTRRKRRTPEGLNAVRLSSEHLLETIQHVVDVKINGGGKLEGLDPKRNDVILAGALILEQAIHGLKIGEITTSAYALREGIVFDTVQKTRDIEEYHHLSHLRFHSVDHLCEQFKVNKAHAEHVRDLSLMMFDELAVVHGYSYVERELLEAAALLHDVGYHISADQHHKHAEYIIRNSQMPGFTNSETALIGCIARYHRKSHPKKKHPTYSTLSQEDQKMVSTMASMLRIAEGLDRRQQQNVKSIRIATTPQTIDIVAIAPSQTPDIELWGAERRKALMEEVFQREVVLGSTG